MFREREIMRDKQEIPKYHHAGNVKYGHTKIQTEQVKKIPKFVASKSEVNCLSKIDLIKLNEESYEKNVFKSS
jgi:hypothetical protein